MRTALALLRMLLLYAALWGIATLALLQFRADRQAGVGSMHPLPAMGSAFSALPFSGVNVSLERFESRPERVAYLRRLRADGFGWVRQRIDWAQVEPQPGDRRWDAVDSLIYDIRAAGLVPVLVLDGSPSWSRAAADSNGTNGSLAPPADPRNFADFAADFAARYGRDVQFYQIWDEPNIALHWGARWVDPVEYTQMLKIVSAAIRQVDPDAAIISAALAPTADRGHLAIDEVYFLQRMIAAGAGRYVDAFAIQPYGFGYSAQDPTQHSGILNFHRAVLVRRALIAAGMGDKHLIAAQYGWSRQPHSHWGTVSESLQRRFAVDALDLAYSEWPWLAGMAWALDAPETMQNDRQTPFALTDMLSSDLAAWHAQSPARGTLSPPAPVRDWFQWGLLAIATVATGWRLRAAMRVPPWRRWRNAYLHLSPWLRAAIWASLLGAYWFAAWPPLIAACWAVAAVLILAQPANGLWLAAAIVPFHFQHKEVSWGELSLTIAPATAAALCLLPALGIHVLRKPRPPDRWDVLAAAWVAVLAFSAFGVWHWPAYSRGWIEFAAVPLVLFWSVRAFTQAGSDRRAVLGALVAGGALVALVGLVGWLRGGGTEADTARRLVGPYFSANHAALYLERTLFVALGLALFYGGVRRWAFGLATILVLTALLLTASRGALLLALPAGPLVLLLNAVESNAPAMSLTGSYRRRLALAPLAAVAVIVAAVLVLPIERLTNIATVSERWLLWQSAARLLIDNWLTGVGPNGFFWTFPAYIPAGAPLDPNLLHPHNVWLEFALIGGVAGIAWLVAAAAMTGHAVMVARGTRTPAWPGYGLLAALVASLAHAQVDAFGALPDLAAWNWIALGLLAAAFSGSNLRA